MIIRKLESVRRRWWWYNVGEPPDMNRWCWCWKNINFFCAFLSKLQQRVHWTFCVSFSTHQVSVQLFADDWTDFHDAHEDEEAAEQYGEAWKQRELVSCMLSLYVHRTNKTKLTLQHNRRHFIIVGHVSGFSNILSIRSRVSSLRYFLYFLFNYTLFLFLFECYSLFFSLINWFPGTVTEENFLFFASLWLT